MNATQLAVCMGCPLPRAVQWLTVLLEVMRDYEINTPKRQAAFLAQIGHESLGLLYTAEIWGPTPAQTRYEGRADLGNTVAGDGRRFAGHGLIQVTGRANHAAATRRLRLKYPDCPDFVANPKALAQPLWAARSAGDFWAAHGCNELADASQFDAITEVVNGGQNGRIERQDRYIRCMGVLA